MFKTKKKFKNRASEIRASHSDFVSSTVANVIKHKPMLLLISQSKLVKIEKADRLT